VTPRAEELRGAEGRRRVEEDRAELFPVRAMLGILDRDGAVVEEGSPVPQGWHWFYFRTPVRASRTGPDGHERRGDFLPAVDLPLRMWAGGELHFPGEVRIGERIRRESTIRSAVEKTGKSGSLVFVTVDHRVFAGDRLAVQEEQIIVYRDRSPASPEGKGAEAAPLGAPAPPLPEPDWSEPFTPDEATLFRFSALTYNGHRIHYDHPYTTGVEGYPGLVVHAPLTALLLLDAAGRHAEGQRVASFSYRAKSPLHLGEPLLLQGDRLEGGVLRVRAATPTGRIIMEATAGVDGA
jgi:3-methylfumaryl-CoA hydratase